MFKRPLTALTLLAITGTACASEWHTMDPSAKATPKSAKWVLNAAVLNGGTKIIRETEVNTGIERDAIRGGGLYQVAAGALFPLNDDIAVQATAGIVRDSLHSNVNNAKAQFHKKFVEVIPYWGVDNHRFGLGVTYFWGADFKVNLPTGPDFKVGFDDLAAPTIAYDWFYNDDFSLGLRATKATFESDEPALREIDADNVGVQLAWYL